MDNIDFSEEAENLFKIIDEANPDVIWMFSPDWKELKFINDAYEKFWNRSKKELMEDPMDFLSGIHPGDRQKVKNKMEELSNENQVELEYRVIPKGNEEKIYYLWVKGKPVYKDGKEFTGVAGFARDITERKKQEKELKKERDFINKTINTLDDIFYVVGKNGELLRWNNSLLEVTGYTKKEVSNMKATDFFPENQKEKISNAIEETLEKGYSTIQIDFLTKEGRKIPYELTGSRLTDSEGNILGLVGIGRDITERKKREKNLKRQNRHLKNFAALISHELRNPLNIAQMNLEFLGNSTSKEKIRNSMDRIEKMITRLLMYTKTGKRIEEKHNINLDSIAKESWKVIIEDDATLNIEDDIEIKADPEMLRHLLENLFKNAVENGASTVYLGKLENGFYVGDDGSGIPEEKREKVFDVGYSDKGDTGLGLALVEQIVTGHNWDIKITESSYGGAKFEIYTEKAN